MRTLTLVTALSLVAACGPQQGELFFLRSRGADMPIWVRGALASPTLLLVVHGGPGETSFNLPESPGFALLERSTAIAYWDQRASGTSQGTASDATLTLSQFREDLDLVVNLLRERYPEKKLVVVGYSWGGTLSAHWLTTDPTAAPRLAGWISLSGATDIPLTVRLSRAWALERIDARIAAGDTAQDWPKLRAWYDANPTFSATDYLKHSGFVSYLGDGDSHRSGVNFNVIFNSPYSNFTIAANGAHTGPFVLAQIFDLDSAPGLATVTVPALIISGALDGKVPVGVGDETFDALGTPPSRKERLIAEHSGHSMYLDEPEAFAERVAAFLTRVVGP
jgi:pimeloyl-ACP methyl ester carboxylesterase